MKFLPCAVLASLASLLAGAAALVTAEEKEKALSGPEERGSLEDRAEKIRGDSGKWRDEARLQVSPPVPPSSGKGALDEWADSLADEDTVLDAAGDTWLIYRTEQLNDNDRVWVESVETDEESRIITVRFARATWRGNYWKNFTWYSVTGLNLGELSPGDYEAVWIERPLEFSKFVDPENRRASWPADARPAPKAAARKHVVNFSVVP